MNNVPENIKPILKRFKKGTKVQVSFHGNTLTLKPQNGKALRVKVKVQKAKKLAPKPQPKPKKKANYRTQKFNRKHKRKGRKWNVAKYLLFKDKINDAVWGEKWENYNPSNKKK